MLLPIKKILETILNKTLCLLFMKITICGFPGSGKGTVSDILASNLKYKQLSIGQLRRNEAKKRNMSLKEFNLWAESNVDDGDIYFDDLQKELGQKEDNFIFDGRMSFHMIPDSFKIYLDCSLDESAKRIFNAKRTEEDSLNLDQTKQMIKERLLTDKKRYETLYQIPVYDLSMFDCVIDTTNLTPQQTADEIMKQLSAQ